MFEEVLVSFFNLLTNILNSFRANKLPGLTTFSLFSSVFLKLFAAQVLFLHLIISFVESDATIIDNSRHINGAF